MQLLLSINFHLEQKSQNSEKMFNTIYLEILKIVDLKQKVLDWGNSKQNYVRLEYWKLKKSPQNKWINTLQGRSKYVYLFHITGIHLHGHSYSACLGSKIVLNKFQNYNTLKIYCSYCKVFTAPSSKRHLWQICSKSRRCINVRQEWMKYTVVQRSYINLLNLCA